MSTNDVVSPKANRYADPYGMTSTPSLSATSTRLAISDHWDRWPEYGKD